MRRIRVAAAWLAAVSMFICAPAAFGATQTIGGEPVRVFLGDEGEMQAIFTDPAYGNTEDGFWYGSDNAPAQAGFFLRQFTSGGNTTWGSVTGTSFTPVSNTSSTTNGDGFAETVYEARNGTTPVFRVRQIARTDRGTRFYTMTYEVTNLTDTAQRFRAGTAGDLYVDGDDSGIAAFIGSSPRFVGGSNTASRVVGGAEEALQSQLPGETSPTAIPPWAAYQVAGYSDTAYTKPTTDGGYANQLVDTRIDNGVGVQWDDHLAEPNALAPGATARYEVRWRLRQAAPITLTPSVEALELPDDHVVLAQLRDSDDRPLANRPVRWMIEGAHPAVGSGLSNDAGELLITINGVNVGVDTITAWIDEDGNTSRDGNEAAAGATVRWLVDNRVEGPPSITVPDAPGGGQVQYRTTPDPDNPDAVTYEFTRGSTSGFSECANGGRQMNLPVSLTLNPGAGVITNVELLQVQFDDDPALASGASPSGTSGNTYSWTIGCVYPSDLYVRYTLTEGSETIVIIVPIGGLLLIDPQGVVYDGDRYDAALAAAGVTEATATEDQRAAARAAGAITGATARLQRQVGSEFRNVLSGDPGIRPNVNPQITRADGLFQWDVAPGVYRVLISAPGYVDVTSRSVTIPPPVLDLHIRMEPVRNIQPNPGGGSTGGGGGTATTPGTTPPATTTPRKCVSRRRIVLTLPRQRKGVRYRKVSVRVDGKRIAAKRRGRKVTISLKGRLKSRYQVSIVAKRNRGRAVTVSRYFRTCVYRRR